MSIPGADNPSVVMIVPNFPPLPMGGAETQCLRLSKRLIQRGVRVLVVTQGRSDLPLDDTVEGVPVHRHYTVLNRLWGGLAAGRQFLRKRRSKNAPAGSPPESRPEPSRSPGQELGPALFAFAFLFFLNTLVFLWRRRRDFQIIHVHTVEWAAVLGAVMGRLLGKAVLIKDSTMNGMETLRRYPFGRWLQPWLAGRCFFVATTRMIEAGFLAAGVPPVRIFRIPNGIDLPADLPPRTTPGFCCLFVGNLYQQPAKGFDVLLQAWPQVLGRCPHAVLHVAGDGDLDRYRAQARHLQVGHTVVFHGRVRDLEEKYRSADLFILPSRREGMSNALLEAMVHGLPCVATDISGNQDLIEDGRSGLLVPVEDADRLAQRIVQILEHPETARQLGLNGKAAVERLCNMDATTERYLQAYKGMEA